MIRVCSACSNVDMDKLRDVVFEEDLEIGCIYECGEHDDKVFGYIDDKLIIKDNEEDFIKAVIEARQ
jgi:hypothetical protein